MPMSLRNTSILLPVLLPVLFLLQVSGCRQSDSTDAGEAAGMASAAAGELMITREQFERAGMRTGEPESFAFSLTTSGRGIIQASPSGQVRISPLIPGQVRNLPVNTGSFVRKGQVLFTLVGREIILLQQQYASAFQQLKAVRSNYERQKALSEGEYTSLKDLSEAESAYMSLVSTVEGLKAQLELLKLDPGNAEKGTFFSEISMVAPIQGYVTTLDLVLGQFIQPEETVMEIVDPDQLLLQLNLYQSDLQDLEVGQPVQFYKPNAPDELFEGRLTRLGKSVDPVSKTVPCLAEIRAEQRSQLMHHQYVECRVITCMREALAIPDEALIEEDGLFYVLSLLREDEDHLFFKKARVNIGVVQQDHAEVLDKGLKGILLEGVYDLSGQE